MTLQTMDVQTLETLLRRIVREEIRQVIVEQTDEESASAKDSTYATDEAFRKSADKIFKTHKKVLDALA